MSDLTSTDEYSHFFELRLDLFEGPIDLLLHLVKQNELPIEKVSLAEVSSQYLRCIENAKDYDLEIAAEYLVIAATLISIKASVLLNEPVELVPDAEGNLVDPHEELLRRLREAAVYRQGAEHLTRRHILGVDVFPSPSILSSIEGVPAELPDHDPMLLGKAFKKLLDQAGESISLTISVESISIMERMMNILDILKKNGGSQEFTKLVPDLTSRGSIIASFVSLLELCKRRIIKVKQDQVFDTIHIVLASEEAADQLSRNDADAVSTVEVSANG